MMSLSPCQKQRQASHTVSYWYFSLGRVDGCRFARVAKQTPGSLDHDAGAARCNMIYTRRPTPEEHQELQRMRRQEAGWVSQRAHVVLLSGERRPVPEIAAIFHSSCATIRSWV
jgi:hypothetical protein